MSPIELIKYEKYFDSSESNHETVSYGGVAMEGGAFDGEWKTREIPTGEISHYKVTVFPSLDNHMKDFYESLEWSYSEAVRYNDEHDFTRLFRKPVEVIEKDQLRMKALDALKYVADRSKRAQVIFGESQIGFFELKNLGGLQIPLGETCSFLVPVYTGMSGWYFDQGVQALDVEVRFGTRKGSYDRREIEWGVQIPATKTLLQELEKWASSGKIKCLVGEQKLDARYSVQEVVIDKKVNKQPVKGHSNKSAGHNPFAGLADLLS